MTINAGSESIGVGSCWECGYSLRGLDSRRCPECGRPFDPADPVTMNMDVHVGAFAKRLMKPPGWSLHLLTALAMLLSLWAAATPMPSGFIGTIVLRLWQTFTPPYYGQSPLPVLLSVEMPEVRYFYAFAAWGLVAGMWWARRVARGVVVRRVAGLPPAKFAYWRRWLIPHAVLVATVLFCMTPAPVFLGFWASRPAIEAARLERLAGRTPPRIRWIGIYPAMRGSGGRVFDDGDPNRVTISGWGGFVYAPGGPPQQLWERKLRAVGGGWYAYPTSGW